MKQTRNALRRSEMAAHLLRLLNSQALPGACLPSCSGSLPTGQSAVVNRPPVTRIFAQAAEPRSGAGTMDADPYRGVALPVA